MNKSLYLLCSLTFLLTLSCNSESNEIYILPENADKLIANLDGKTWKIARRYNNGTRMNMGDCFLSYRIMYFSDGTVKDNNGDFKNCGPTLLANWEFEKDEKQHSYLKLTSDQLPKLMNIDRNYKYFKILKLSEDTLKIKFRHKQFNDRSSIIIDTYVPEHITVHDRNFHW